MPRELKPSGRDPIRRVDVFRDNREAWLQHVITAWRPLFARVGHDPPARIDISVGRPPKSAWTGCYYPGAASDDGHPSIFVNPVIDDPVRVAGVVVHQLCHVAPGDRRHDLRFKWVAERVGLVGRSTATIEGPLFLQVVPGLVERYGPYPHAALRQLRGLDKKPPGSRLIRVRCLGCGYAMRVTQRWLDIAVPVCPNPRCDERGATMEVG